MATQNFVLLTGMIATAPTISIVNDVKQASFDLFTLRKHTPTPAGADGSDTIQVITRDSSIIEQLNNFKLYDIVSVLGKFYTVDVPKFFMCQNEACKEYNVPVSYKGSMSYISPTEIMPVCIETDGGEPSKVRELDSKLKLLSYRDHSNTALIIGRCIGSPIHTPIEIRSKKHPSKKELLHTWQVKVFVKRPTLAVNSLTKVDHITVLTYEDISHFKDKDFIAVDGFVRAKKYNKIRTCPCCKGKIQTSDSSLGIVAYNIEHIEDRKD